MVLEQLAVNGIIAGSEYALLAIGLTLIYGILRLIHFAHGEVAMVGAYSAFVVSVVFGLPLIAGFFVAIAAGALLGIAVNRIAFRPVRKQHILIGLITAIAVSILLQNAIALFFGNDIKTYNLGAVEKGIEVFGFIITKTQIVIVFTAVALMLLTWAFIKKTKIGQQVRAVADNRELAESIGIDSEKVIACTFAFGSALAAAGGVLIAAETNLAPMMGLMPNIKAFAAIIVGGIGSIPGAIFGSYFIGLAENIGIWFLPSGYKDAIAFFILVIFLLFMPTGIFGKKKEGIEQ
ncbi:MAG: branched-chain amino acid ABC transporter permease [Candidatus Diapherotrites archaeon]|nr:branched-chain amino acid ABC transporter permease [Candidatus Diapherotrites archaeon]